MTNFKELLADKSFVARVREVTGLVPRDETLPEDVFIISYPKSGTTWLQNLIAGAVYGLNLEHVPFTLIAELIPGRNQRFYRRHSTPMFFKSHLLPREQYKRVIYLLRDGRDVMVSYYHYRKNLNKTDDFLAMVQDTDIYPSEWHTHVERWLVDQHNAELLLVRYEDLKSDAVAELKRICAFANLDRDEAWLRSVVEQASFENMRRREQQFGMHIANWDKDNQFMRRGKSGSFRDEMPAEVLEAFMAKAGDILRKFGYIEG